MSMRLNLPLAALVIGAGVWCARDASGQSKADEKLDLLRPGKLVDIGGRKLHLHCTGAGSPTVVLVAGGSAYAIDWALVQPEIAKSTRVCSYDRAGLGWSDGGPKDETVEQTVGDLHAMLVKSGERGPFILVGASIGGIYIQAYQHSYPDEVAGLVFSNSSNRVGLRVGQKNGLLWDLTDDEVRAALAVPFPKGEKPVKEDDPFDRFPADLRGIRLMLDVKAWRDFDPAKATPDSMLSWRKEFLREFEASEAKDRPLGALPVMVISSYPGAQESERKSRGGAAARLDYLSSNTVHVTATGSGHEIHVYQPATVTGGILRSSRRCGIASRCRRRGLSR